MKSLKIVFAAFALLFAALVQAVPVQAVVQTVATTSTFHPADFFSPEQPLLAATESEHQHGDDAATAQEQQPSAAAHEHDTEQAGDVATPAAGEGKNCKRGGGCCCCCKCCCKGEDKAKSADMKGCSMMKKGMMDKAKKGASTKPTTKQPASKPLAIKQGGEHEAHH